MASKTSHGLPWETVYLRAPRPVPGGTNPGSKTTLKVHRPHPCHGAALEPEAATKRQARLRDGGDVGGARSFRTDLSRSTSLREGAPSHASAWRVAALSSEVHLRETGERPPNAVRPQTCRIPDGARTNRPQGVWQSRGGQTPKLTRRESPACSCAPQALCPQGRKRTFVTI